jgi:hypothetical protein
VKKLNTIDKVLIILASFLFVFIVATMVIYTVNGWQFDTLITCVLGAGGIETIAGAFIQVAKYKHKKEEDDES